MSQKNQASLTSLFQHIRQYIKIDEKECQTIASFFEYQQLNKKEVLQIAGQRCQHHFFVTNGCLHMYFVNEKGIRQTVQFAIENWWLTDHLAFVKNAVTDFYIQAAIASEVLWITPEKEKALFQAIPKLETYFRCIYQIAYGASLHRLKYIYGLSKEDSYFYFVKQFPDFAQRVPQYLIASFLGLTPEYVSEIRKKKR